MKSHQIANIAKNKNLHYHPDISGIGKYYLTHGNSYEDLPLRSEDIDDSKTYENGFLNYEDSKTIIFYWPPIGYNTDPIFDLQYAFPIYFNREYIKLKRDLNCFHCNEIYNSAYMDEDSSHEWICPKCHSKNDIYERYYLKEVFMPQPDDATDFD